MYIHVTIDWACFVIQSVPIVEKYLETAICLNISNFLPKDWHLSHTLYCNLTTNATNLH